MTTARESISTLDPTRYEIALVAPDGSRALLRYSYRKSGDALREVLFARAEQLIAITGTNRFDLERKGALSAMMGAYRIEYTGRTQREAAAAGELPYLQRSARTLSDPAVVAAVVDGLARDCGVSQ